MTTKRPKGLIGRDQKVSGSDRPSSDEGDDIQNPTGVQTPTDPIQILLHRQLGKPDAPHHGGSPTAREGDGAAGKRGRRKRRPPCNGADRAASAGIPDPKGCRLPTGLGGKEPRRGPSPLETLGDDLHRTDQGTNGTLVGRHRLARGGDECRACKSGSTEPPRTRIGRGSRTFRSSSSGPHPTSSWPSGGSRRRTRAAHSGSRRGVM